MPAASKTWFITGCSSGFGSEFVRQLRAAGDNVIATGRNASTKLAHLKETGAFIMDLDVTAPPSEIQAKLDEAWSVYPGGIDVVVNNAGFILSGAIEELTQEEMDFSFKTNFHGPINITRAVLPNMRTRGTGTLVFLSSIGGWCGAPGAGAYASSKFALEGAVECLEKELALVAPGIKLFMPEPGYFGTSVFSNVNHVPPQLEAYAGFNAGSRAFEEGLVGNEPGDPAKGVQIMLELIKGTGVAEGKQVPLRLPMGTDGFTLIKQKCEETLKLIGDWEHIAKLTDLVNS